MFFVIDFFLTIISYQFKRKSLDFHKSRLIFLSKILSTPLWFPVLKISQKSSNTVIKIKNFSLIFKLEAIEL